MANHSPTPAVFSLPNSSHVFGDTAAPAPGRRRPRWRPPAPPAARPGAARPGGGADVVCWGWLVAEDVGAFGDGEACGIGGMVSHDWWYPCVWRQSYRSSGCS